MSYRGVKFPSQLLPANVKLNTVAFTKQQYSRFVLFEEIDLVGDSCFRRHIFFLLPRCSHTWELAPALEHRAEVPKFPDQGQSIGLLGRVISSSQGLYTNRDKTHTQTITSMPWVGSEPTVPASERAKTVHALDNSATVTGFRRHSTVQKIRTLH
jgi:hypothetical protein